MDKILFSTATQLPLKSCYLIWRVRRMRYLVIDVLTARSGFTLHEIICRNYFILRHKKILSLPERVYCRLWVISRRRRRRCSRACWPSTASAMRSSVSVRVAVVGDLCPERCVVLVGPTLLLAGTSEFCWNFACGFRFFSTTCKGKGLFLHYLFEIENCLLKYWRGNGSYFYEVSASIIQTCFHICIFKNML